jgi:hypothetical protein
LRQHEGSACHKGPTREKGGKTTYGIFGKSDGSVALRAFYRGRSVL